MPALHNIPAIRALLEADRAWAAYPLGDLAPGFIEHCSWFQPPRGSGALALLYRAVRPPVLFTQGDPESLGARYRIVELRRMWRMVLSPKVRLAAPARDVVRLSMPTATPVGRARISSRHPCWTKASSTGSG